MLKARHILLSPLNLNEGGMKHGDGLLRLMIIIAYYYTQHSLGHYKMCPVCQIFILL